MSFSLPSDSRRYENAYIVNVTPELARNWLNRNFFNRPVTSEIVQLYIQQIENGLWHLTHQGVAFTEQGVLLDGQHRLAAVVATGVTVPMAVFANEPEENYEFIDCGRRRSELDMLRLAHRDQSLSTAHKQTLLAFLAGRFCKTNNQWSSAELNIALDKYGEAIKFATDLFHDCKDKMLCPATLRGLIARAYYYTTPDRLVDFVTQLLHGDRDQNKPISILRDYLHVWKDRRENTKREIYRRSQQILFLFLYGEKKKYYLDTTPDVFPIKKDEEIEAGRKCHRTGNE